ncbi:NYN domain-containing protein [Marinomonas shanghaiensis]|uniref:NYN domain-containing protein n=1 Tax=Marinomonas shanghaiensis TaxID=2202418 RepID=UPI000DBA7A94|nr:NYN domain-containing protein [Marinomonas shanghaiensis]
MKTRVYIDGYNFYFGCLKGSPYKWLDPVSLVETLLVRSGVPESVLDELAVKFFTAEISERAASDSSSLNDQRAYHLALHNHRQGRLQTVKGNYTIDKTKFPKVELDERGKEKEPKFSERVKIWKMEEKQSDVNVALEAVYDAVTDLTLEHIVFVTNDTDIIPALRKIHSHNALKQRSPVKIGLIIPMIKGDSERQGNKSLKDFADWTIKYIHEEELKISQLPCRVAGAKSAIKPISWFRYPERVQEVLNTLSQKGVEGSVPKAWKWLERPLHPADGLEYIEGIPAELMDDDTALEIIYQHAQAYADHKKRS